MTRYKGLILSSIIYILIGSQSPGYGQVDTIKVFGQLSWKDKSITGFPEKVSISSKDQPTLSKQAAIDSLGNYSIFLPPGTYQVTPARSYHWMGEEYIRIDHKNSLATIVVGSGEEVIASTLEINSIPPPDLTPEKGIMHKFNAKKALLLDNFVKVHMEYFDIPGASLALIKNGQIIYHKTYGLKNTSTKAPVDEKTLFEAGSITKPVFAFVVCRLAEKGILDLDKPLHLYLPFEDVAHDDRYKLITARHVLSHRTGFPNWAKRNEKGQFDLRFTPGTDFGYSGEGFEYLKRVVERVTKKDIGIILEEELLKPLNLAHFYFEKSEYLAEFAANGHYDQVPTEIRLPESPGMAWSMSTEARSFSAFIIALNNREGLQPETYHKMFSVHSTIPKDDSEKKAAGMKIYIGD
ncbi:serine hydrolase domain-containing protein [Fulvivirgaceae bacterium BMA12]|uniref:Serine hydrolase domain-containing protein n=1 Tax=Agaribacillus aureus TaxID=3051825 RepID=A0ABT8LCL2_9BACT|nr:serine hydrolase domain-containing protein [Fulvivirgaceae bacterium BMA12]